MKSLKKLIRDKNMIRSLCVCLLSLNSSAFCLPPTQDNTRTLDKLNHHESSISFSADILLDKIYAVHASSSLPDYNYLRAGLALDGYSGLEKALMPKARKTLHFALGELVRPIDGFMSWEDCPYAIITPLRVLQPQLININCYDTFILGDLKLTDQSYLVLPDNVAKTTASRATIITYDPNNQTLRETVDALILQKEGWHIEMNSDDVEDELHEAYLNGNNINSPEFFAPLKEIMPGLASGLRFDPLDGEHYRLSQIEQNLLFVAMQILSDNYRETAECSCLETSHLEKLAQELHEDFAAWASSLANFNWSNDSLEAYQNLAIEITKWSHLIQIELLLRNQHQKTLMSAPFYVLLKGSKFLNRPDRLLSFIIQHKEMLLDFPNT